MSENKEWITRVQELHNMMRKLTLEAGVSEKIYDKLVRRLERKDDDSLWKLLEFFESLHRCEYGEVHRIWTLPGLSEEVWTNYFTMFRDTPFEEVVLLKQARKILKGKYVAFWKNRPRKPRRTNTASVSQTSPDGGVVCQGDTRQ